MLIPKKSVTLLFILFCSGLKITADQRTMSGLIADLTGQTLILIAAQFDWSFLDSNIFFCCVALKPSKKKTAAIN